MEYVSHKAGTLNIGVNGTTKRGAGEAGKGSVGEGHIRGKSWQMRMQTP